MKMLKTILESGYEFGEPWKFNDQSLVAVVPIIKHGATLRGYVLLQEVQDQVEIRDTGSIGKTVIKNPTDKTVFIRKGTLLKGATQERGVTAGIIVLPSMTKEVEVQCVHASRGIQAGAVMKAAKGVAPSSVMHSFMARRSQSETWNAVGDATRSYLAMASPSGISLDFDVRGDNLVGVLEQTDKFKEEVEKVLEKVPADLTSQAGIAIVDMRGVQGLELFDHPDSWRAFSKSIVRSYADILGSEEKSELFELKLDKIVPAVTTFLKNLSEAKETIVNEVEGGKTCMLDGEKVVGEYTALKGQTIHLIASRREEEKKEKETIPLPWNTRTTRRTATTSRSRYEDPWNVQWQMSTGTPQYLFAKKGAYYLLNSLTEEPKTWTELERKLNLSPKTLAKRVSEAKQEKLITQAPRENGRMTYILTEKGEKALKWARGNLAK